VEYVFHPKIAIPAFSAIFCMKSLRAISMHAAERSKRAVSHAINRGLTLGEHIAKDAARPAKKWQAFWPVNASGPVRSIAVPS
jgi:hypothetical protein